MAQAGGGRLAYRNYTDAALVYPRRTPEPLI